MSVCVCVTSTVKCVGWGAGGCALIHFHRTPKQWALSIKINLHLTIPWVLFESLTHTTCTKTYQIPNANTQLLSPCYFFASPQVHAMLIPFLPVLT